MSSSRHDRLKEEEKKTVLALEGGGTRGEACPAAAGSAKAKLGSLTEKSWRLIDVVFTSTYLHTDLPLYRLVYRHT